MLQLATETFLGSQADDFAHLSAFITALNFKGFGTDGKFTHFRQAEDLMQITFRTYIQAWLIQKFKISSNLPMSMQREQVCDNLYHMGADCVETEVIEQLFTDLFDIKHNTLRQMMNEDPDSPYQQEQIVQVSHILSFQVLYMELRDTVKAGRVGKLPDLFRLILPWFAGSKKYKYTRELVSLQIMYEAIEPETFNRCMDGLLTPAKGKGFMETDMVVENQVNNIKAAHEAKGGGHTWHHTIRETSLLLKPLNESKIALASSIQKKSDTSGRKHYNPDLTASVDNMTHHVLYNGTIRDGIKLAKRADTKDLFSIGMGRLGKYDIEGAIDVIYGHKAYLHTDEPGDESNIGGRTDTTGVFPDGGDLADDEEDSAVPRPARVAQLISGRS